MSCGFLRETLCFLPSVPKQSTALLSCVPGFKLLKGCDGTRSLCCHVSEPAASGWSDPSRSWWNTREGISKQLPTVSKDTEKPRGALGALCRSVVLGGQMGKQVTTSSKLQKWLRGSCPLVIRCARALADERDPLPQFLPGCPACF